MSLSAYSRASDFGRAKKRCARRVRPSAELSVSFTGFDMESLVQAEARSAADAASTPRRGAVRSRAMIVSLDLDRVAPGDHRAQVVPDAGDQNHEQVERHERHQEPRHDEVDAPRRLAPAHQ